MINNYQTQLLIKEEVGHTWSYDKSLWSTIKGNRYFWIVWTVASTDKNIPVSPYIYYLLPDILMIDTDSKKDKVHSWDIEPEIIYFPHSF